MPSVRDAFLADFDFEAANSRRLLERVPDDKLGWRPHPKSTPLGALAQHIVGLQGMPVMVLGTDTLDVADSPPQPTPGSRQEMLALFDQNVEATRAALATTTDDGLQQPWSLTYKGQSLFTMPRIDALRQFMLHHSIHHRAQLGVYLRLNDVPLPGMYGPTADEA